MPERFLASVLPQHETAELYRLMVVGIKGTAVFLMNPDGIITVWNKAAEEMKGYSADEAIGSFVGMLYTDADQADGLPARNLSVARASGSFSEEQWRKRKDGSLFWAHVSITALRNERDELLGFSKVTMDLTHHKLLEQCTEEKNEIDLILRAAEAGTWKWHAHANEVQVSAHLMQLLGYDAQPRTLRLEQWLAYVHEADRAHVGERLGRVRSVAAAPLEMELRLQRRDGRFGWFFLRANWHDAHAGQAPVFLGACVAIDSIKRAEQEHARLADQIARERARFSDILQQMPSGVVLAELPSGKLIWQNRAAVALLGDNLANVDSVADYARFEVFHPDGTPVPVDQLPLARTVADPGYRGVQELIIRRVDGRLVDVAVTAGAVRDGDGQARLAVAVVHDIGELKQAQLAAATEKERALVTLAAITDGVLTTDRSGRITSVNPAAERMLGLVQAQVRGRHVREVLAFDEPGGASTIIEAVDRCLHAQHAVANLPHLTMHRGDKLHFAVESAVAPVMLANGELIGAVLVLHDVTESRRLMRRLGFEASHDALTGLINRREFETRLQRALERARSPGGDHAALLYMDLDQFKVVNDTCGHQAGDELLKLLAASYAEQVRERDTLARIGGDEFALIVEHCEVDEALAVAHKILEATRNFRYACKGQVFQPGVSVGLSPIDRSTASVEEAMRRADHACYIAKERGRNRVYVNYQGDLDFAQRRSDMHWVTRLSHAFQHEQLQLFYQPIVALEGDGQRYHYEILLRLRNGRAPPIHPGTFLPAAERYDVILKVDRWVLSHTLAWLAAHAEHTGRLDMCSINLSRRSLGDQSFHQFAADLIDASGVPANKLCFEITEHGAIADMPKTIASIAALSRRGCRFALDDFGTGMTSFAYLKQLPVDFIKIDGSLIQSMSASPVDFEMVRFTNDISHMMGRRTIAEYVSNPAILASLKEIGVDFAQGYCMGRPRALAP